MAVGLTLDAGALIGFDRGDRQAVLVIARARGRREPLYVPVGANGQAWRVATADVDDLRRLDPELILIPV
jgi:hypothetical protein